MDDQLHRMKLFQKKFNNVDGGHAYDVNNYYSNSNWLLQRFVVMTVVFASLLATTLCGAAVVVPVGTQLITSPPKLESESTRVVWYQIPSSGNAHKFELKCHASGDPERYEWTKSGRPYTVDKKRVVWQREGQSGTIVFLYPDITDQGFYQCKAINIFGVAVSNIFEVKLGALDHFANRPVKEIVIEQGETLTLPCKAPHGVPQPSIFWLFRNTKQTFVIETIDRPHITVDGDGNLQFSYVELHDGRENLLYQCAATSPVLHGEYRAGDEVRLVVKDAPLIHKPPNRLWFTPSDVRVTSGETLKLMCIFSGYPVPKVVWLKKRGELPVERMGHENFGRTLVIRPVLPNDEGTYICKVDDIEHEMLVQVTSAPQWIYGPPENFDLPEEADVELKCKAMGDPPPVVRWYKNGKPIDDLTDLNDRRKIIGGGEILRITNLQHSTDRAVYQCNASNPLGYVFANAYVNVRAHAPEFETPTNQTTKVTIGDYVNLDCSVKAAPLPSVKWLDENNREITQIQGKYEFLPNNTLRISNARAADAHTYFCDVVNKFGINKARRILEVYKPTKFVVSLGAKEKYLDAGDEYEFVCVAESDERLRPTYHWLRNDVPIETYSNTSLKKSPEPNRLRLVNVRGKDSGRYTCVVVTDVDKIMSSMNIMVRDIPDSPIVTNVQCRETQALISWTPAFHNYDRIKEYIVEYNTDFHPNVWKIGVTVTNTDQEIFEAAVNLSPWVVYSFKVVAVNTYGRGNPGYRQSVRCSTPPSYPYDNPSNVSAGGNKKDNLIIHWKPMDKELWNAPGLYYVIRYRLSEALTHNENIEWMERRIEDPFLDHTEIRELPSYRKYLVQVKAVNSLGASLDQPRTVEGYSGEDVPSAAPRNLKAVEVNATAVKFVWEPVNSQSVNGRLRGYRVKAWPYLERAKRSSNKDVFVSVSQFNSYAVLTGVEPMMTYGAHVVVLNTNYEGPPSNVIKFTTPEGPPGPVQNLMVEPYGAQTVLTTWAPPSELKGRLKIYRIEYYEEVPSNRENTVYAAVVLVGENHHLRDSLKPDTNYTVAVWAETGGGAGPRLSHNIRTWPKQNPGKPNFTAQTVDSKTLDITWLPSRTGMPGTSFHVNYSRADFKDWKQTKPVFLPNNKVTINDLAPDMDYKFVLYAKDGDKWTASDVKTFRTVNRTVSEQTRKVEDNLTGAAWFIAVVCALAVAILTVVVVCVCRMNKGGKYPVKKKELERGHHLDKDEEQSFMEYQYGSGSSDITANST